MGWESAGAFAMSTACDGMVGKARTVDGVRWWGTTEVGWCRADALIRRDSVDVRQNVCLLFGHLLTDERAKGRFAMKNVQRKWLWRGCCRVWFGRNCWGKVERGEGIYRRENFVELAVGIDRSLLNMYWIRTDSIQRCYCCQCQCDWSATWRVEWV